MSGMTPPSLRELSPCGCCTGVTASTPNAIANAAGLSAIAYRVGTYSSFKETMLAALSNARKAGLQGFGARTDDDFSIALLDAWAVTSDVLTFYQERIINESYLRTATERRSLLEVARLIGYRLRPGVAASTYLAFTVDDSPGAPDQAVKQATIDVGTRIQSIPGPGEKPQTFETIEKIDARPEWNAIRPRLTRRHVVRADDTVLFLEGIATGLKAGDTLVLHPESDEKPVVTRVKSVITHAAQQRTEVELDPPVALRATPAPSTPGTKLKSLILSNVGRATAKYLGKKEPEPATKFKAAAVTERFNTQSVFANLLATRPPPPTVTAFRIRASIFGHNAPAWDALPISQRYHEDIPKMAEDLFPFSSPLVTAFQPRGGGLYAGRSHTWADKTLNEYHGLEGTKRVDLDQPYQSIIKGSSVLLQDSDNYALYRVDAANELSKVDFGLSGKFTRLTLDSSNGFNLFGIRSTTVYAQSEELNLARFPIPDVVSGPTIELDGWIDGLVEGQSLIFSGELDDMRGVRANERVVIMKVEHVFENEGFTRLTVSGLKHAYLRDTVTINANCARATHGETVQEVLGNGDASLAHQKLSLHQGPLTYTSAANPAGAESTLEVRINDLLWKETPTLYHSGPNDHLFVTSTNNSGETAVMFGDGSIGARSPTGQNNIRAKYRKGIGVEGSVKAGQLSLLVSRPLGVKGVTNPLDATGAEDPEPPEEARRNASLSVLTLDRIVSLRDYEDFANAFAGIRKAHATWAWNGHNHGVFVTVAGPNGADVSKDTATYVNLLSAMRKAGDPFVHLLVESFRPAFFRIAVKLKLGAAYLPEKVLADAEAALRNQFSFDMRSFGQPVMRSEVVAVLQRVPGVVAVDIDRFYRTDSASPTSELRLVAKVSYSSIDSPIEPAELLTLDPSPLDYLGVMP
jgi:hypothetical protein